MTVNREEKEAADESGIRGFEEGEKESGHGLDKIPGEVGVAPEEKHLAELDAKELIEIFGGGGAIHEPGGFDELF